DVLTFAPELIVPDEGKSLKAGALAPWAGSWRSVAWPKLQKLSKDVGVSLDKPWRELSSGHRKLLLEGDKTFRGVIPFLERLQQKSYKAGNRFVVKRYQVPRACTACGGTRLRPEALRVTLGGKSIAEVCALPVAATGAFVAGLRFGESQRTIAGPALGELESRLRFLLR